MSQFDAELLVLLVRDFYGSLASTVIDTLLKEGRLSLSLLARYSSLSTATIQRVLVPLLQLRFVRHSVFDSPTTYVVSPEHIYSSIVRAGQIIAYVDDIFSEEESSAALQVIKNLLLYGHIRISDYLSAAPNPAASTSAIATLLRRKLLTTLTTEEFAPESDRVRALINEKLASIPRKATVSESKRAQAAELEAQEAWHRIATRHDSLSDGFLSSGEVDTSVVVTVNHEKFAVLARSRVLVDFAKRRIGAVTAAVYKHVLETMEPRLFRSDESRITISSLEILKNLDEDLDLGHALAITSRRRKRDSSGSDSESSQQRPHKRRRKENDSSSSESESDYEMNGNNSKSASQMEVLNMHLALLCSSPSLPFLKRVGSKGGGEYTIDFSALMNSIRALEYDKLIAKRQGAVACRLLRIIRDKGRIDEKQIAQAALLPAKEIRAHLTALHECGGLDLQEVPRGADRAPSRTYYLWHHRPAAAHALMAQQVIRAMTRCYARVIDERARRPGVFAKIAREAALSAAEVEEVRKLRDVEEKLVVQITRLDRLVLVFRDCL
ncbi:RNA polymerase III subunit RPC82-domain-containing protein [Kockiozyma suomiensis]|uniref:RNA polymerase III subunit RPC82-domain-containing protein n=1 Tax=Kockiozyma suomiensis TaxID=1337062 RepID=UPI003343DA49